MRYRAYLLAAASVATLFATESYAQPTETMVDEIVVTGTRIARSRLDTTAPVDVVSAQDLQRQATTETAQALTNLAPSLDFPRPAITDGTDSVRPATLRGLSPDQTLVLVNGRRRHASALVNANGSIGRGSSAVDLNTIPTVALQTVEILRDGASAQYGSDAIAGVINLRLREAREGGGVSATFGGYNTEVVTARIPDGYKKNDGRTITVSGWQGLPLGDEGFLTISAEYRDRQPTSRGDIDPRATPLRVRSRYGDPKSIDGTLYANAGLPINETWEAYGWAGYQRRESESAATNRIPTNPNNNPAIYPDGFLPIIAPTIDDFTIAGGLKGEVSGFQIDGSIVHGFNKIDYRVLNSINGSIPNSPTSFDAGNLRYQQTTVSLDVVKPLTLPGVSETNLAFGGQYRDEGYEIGAGELASYQYGPITAGGTGAGSQGFIGFRPSNEVDASRDSIGVYADLDLQVTEAFNVDLAARYEDYSDFGSTSTGKIAARYDFNDSFAIRGAASTGFRAPALQQQSFTATAINFLVLNGVSTPVEIVTLPPSDAIARALGARPLSPEESVNYSLGFVLRAGPLELTIDAYRIEIEDRIVLSENLTGSPTGTATERAIFALINPNGGTVGGARFFINGVDSTTEGLDIVGRYRLTTETLGRFNFTATANFNSTDVTRVPAIPSNIAIPNPPSLFNRINVLSFEQGTPDKKLSAAVDWSDGPWEVSAKSTYYGTTLRPASNTSTAFDDYSGAKTLVDLEGRYAFPNRVGLALGVNNLLDTYPKATPATINTTGALAFSNYSPFGFNGRYLYGRISYNW